jgi:hypothetical protein
MFCKCKRSKGTLTALLRVFTRTCSSVLNYHVDKCGATKSSHVEHIQLKRRMSSSGILLCVALVRTDISEERSTSIIRLTRIGELGTTLA